MFTKKRVTRLVSVLLAFCLLVGCSGVNMTAELVKELKALQSMVEIQPDNGLSRALRQAVQGHKPDESLDEVRDSVLEEMGLQGAKAFSPAGIQNAQDGQHAVGILLCRSANAEDAVRQFGERIAQVLRSLPESGRYKLAVGTAEKEGCYYTAVHLYVIQAGSSGSGEQPQPEPPTEQEQAAEALEAVGSVQGNVLILDKPIDRVSDLAETLRKAGIQEIVVKNKNDLPANSLAGISGLTITMENSSSLMKRDLGGAAEVTLNVQGGTVYEGGFMMDPSVKNLNVSKGSTLGFCAFGYMPNLQEVTLDGSVTYEERTTTGCRAFEKCTQLTHVTLKGVTRLPGCIFYNCSSLADIDGLDRVTEIGFGAFKGCAFTEISLPKLENMGRTAFDSCKQLTTIHSLGKVTEIPAYAFSDCYDLKTITFETELTSIDKNAFSKSNALQVIYYPSSNIDVFNGRIPGKTIKAVEALPEQLDANTCYIVCRS